MIMGIPDDLVAAVDADASRKGVPRDKYPRRTLARAPVHVPGSITTAADLSRFSWMFTDLADDDAMGRAWS
jgi:hypothetical protein